MTDFLIEYWLNENTKDVWLITAADLGVRFIIAIFCSIAVTKAAQRRLSMQLRFRGKFLPLVDKFVNMFWAGQKFSLLTWSIKLMKAQIFLQYYMINAFWAATEMNGFYRKTAEVLQNVDNDG